MPANPAFAELTATLTARASIAAEDVLAMRRLIWGDERVSREEADAIMALNTACRLRAREWIDYFIEVISDYLVHQQEPEGYIDEANAGWLMTWIDKDGRVDSLSELELLVRLLEIASEAPEALRTYAVRQVEQAVLTGEGPTRDGGALDREGINATEVELLRRIVYAQAGDGIYIVSQAEADMLFRLKDATLHARNAASWPDLFVKCVGNHLMAHASYQPLSRDDQTSLDAYIADTHVDLGRFARRALAGQAAAVGSFGHRVQGAFGHRPASGNDKTWDNFVDQASDPRLPASVRDSEARVFDEAAAAIDQAITPDEKGWLLSRIQADGAKDAMEQALLDFIRRESGTAING